MSAKGRACSIGIHPRKEGPKTRAAHRGREAENMTVSCLVLLVEYNSELFFFISLQS